MGFFDWQRVASVIRKEFLQQLRDPNTLRMMIMAPLIQLVVLGFAVNNDPKDLRLAYVDLDHTQASRQVVQDLSHIGYFIVHRVDSQQELLQELDSGAAQVTLQFPPDFERRLAKGEDSPIQLMVDGSDTNTATLAAAYAGGTIQNYAGNVVAQWRERHGGAGSGAADVSTQVWYNPGLLSVNYILPGVVALILGTLASSLTVLSIAREREIGTLEQLLVTPLRTREFMLGKMVAPACLSFFNAVLVTVLSIVLFRVPFHGNILFLFLAEVPYVVAVLGVGLLISSIAKTQQQAQLLNFFFNLPQNLLSGFIFPVATMPLWAQFLSSLLPQRYILEIVRGVYLKGLGPAVLWPQVLALCALSVVLFSVGTRSFRRRLD